MISKKESQGISRMALSAFLESGKMCVRELETVPPCGRCGRVPRQYSRINDTAVICAADDARECARIWYATD